MLNNGQCFFSALHSELACSLEHTLIVIRRCQQLNFSYKHTIIVFAISSIVRQLSRANVLHDKAMLNVLVKWIHTRLGIACYCHFQHASMST